MTAWYVISAMGLYAVDPVSTNYVFGSPSRPGYDSHGERETIRCGSEAVFAGRHVHPVRDPRRKATSKGLLQPRRCRERSHAGLQHGQPAKQGIWSGGERRATVDDDLGTQFGDAEPG